MKHSGKYVARTNKKKASLIVASVALTGIIAGGVLWMNNASAAQPIGNKVTNIGTYQAEAPETEPETPKETPRYVPTSDPIDPQEPETQPTEKETEPQPTEAPHEKHEHKFERTVIKDATCTEDGKAVWICSCGEIDHEEVLPAHGHNWGEWIVDVPAGPGVAGSQHHVCTHDSSHVETGVIDALPEPEHTEDTNEEDGNDTAPTQGASGNANKEGTTITDPEDLKNDVLE